MEATRSSAPRLQPNKAQLRLHSLPLQVYPNTTFLPLQVYPNTTF